MFQYQNVKTIDDPKENTAIGQCPYFPGPERKGYVNLRKHADELTVLKNPHKGWYWHYIDNGFFRGEYRENHDPNDRLTDFPGLNHLYLRFDWGDIEKEEGKPDWSYIDQIMDEWGKYDYRFSLRICTYEGDGRAPFATPEFVYKAGARGYELSKGRLEPDYGDPVFLKKLSAFMAKAGEKFNRDPRIELIDVGTFGTWGEGHTAAGSMKYYPLEVMKKHIDLHADNFPDKPVLLNDDHINARWGVGEADNLALLDYAAERKLGLDDDSVCVRCYSGKRAYNTLRTPWMFDRFWKNGPIVLEFEHYHMVRPEVFKGGYPFLDALRAAHATFAGFHGYPRPWLEREPYLTEYCANRLGYWYFINGAEKDGETVKIYLENRGFGKSYHQFDLIARLSGDGVQKDVKIPADNRDWLPGEEICAEFTLPTDLKENLTLSLGLFENNRPIEFAFDQKRRCGGFYELYAI